MRDPLEDLVLQAFKAGVPALVRADESRTLEQAVVEGLKVFNRLRDRYRAGETSGGVGLLLERECRGEFTEGTITGARLMQLRAELKALTNRERQELVETLRSQLVQQEGQ